MNKAQRLELCEWVALHARCSVCHWPDGDPRRRLHVHHIAGGASRCKGHDKRNYLRLCGRCHDVHHSGKISANVPDITKPVVLFAKQESDPANYDPSYLAWLKSKAHLGYEPSSIPVFYVEERLANSTWSRRRA